MTKNEYKLFSELKIKESIKILLEKNGFINMKQVQKMTIPHILSRKDVIVHSQTGSGKTLSYVVPILDHIDCNANKMKVLVILPTRELCMQVSGIINTFGFKSECFIGGRPISEDIRNLECVIALGTPGRIWELISQNNKFFNNIEYLVLDECDKLLDVGFENKLRMIINLLPRKRVTCMLSATCSEKIIALRRYALRDPVIVKVDEEIPTKLELKYVIVEPENKIDILFKLVENNKAIIFFSTCAEVDLYYSLMIQLQKTLVEKTKNNDNYDWFLKIKIYKIHGKMDQPERSNIYNLFESTNGILLCTDLAARGIDFKRVNLVIHFNIPKDYLNIVHRSGRTARNDESGESIIFLMKNEVLYIDFLKLKKINVNETSIELGNESILGLLKELVDENILQIAVKAFVSYIRSYKEHILNYILSYKELNFDSLAKLFFLQKIPTMAELKNVKFTNFEKAPKTENSVKIIKKRKCKQNKNKRNKI